MEEKLIHDLRVFHYAAGVPIGAYRQGKPYYALPAGISCAMEPGADIITNAMRAEEGTAQYVQTPMHECFIYCRFGDTLLRAGPVCIEAVDQAQIAAMIRARQASIGQMGTLKAHYASLPVLPEKRYYYIGKLMERLFTGAATSAPPAAVPLDEEVEKALFKQTREYRNRLFAHPPYAIELEISRLIAAGDLQHSENVLAEINAMPRAILAPDPLRSLKNSLIGSCTFMTRAAISGGLSPDDAFTLSDAFIQRIEACTQTAQLDGFEIQMIRRFTQRVNRTRRERYSDTVRGVMRFIDTHLSERITVADIAETLYLHPNYLSKLFKQETGVTIHAFLTQKRIEESKYYIRFGSESYAEIAAFYQFCSQSHFIQAFKKQTGVTPAAYRKRYQA